MPRDAAGIAALAAADASMMRALRAVADHAPAGSWVGASFLRNAVWDALHGRAPDVAGLTDIDVVFHDDADASPAGDAAAEAALRAAAPHLPWSVTNQARMHGRNGHAPYAGVTDAIAHWPATATAVALRLGPDWYRTSRAAQLERPAWRRAAADPGRSRSVWMSTAPAFWPRAGRPAGHGCD